jgi:16S rRNA (cytidine1402-2'-O)-methyltransferase
MPNATLYLIPTTLGDTPWQDVMPVSNANVITSLRYFIVEEIRTARRFLKKVDKSIDIDSLTFYTLNRHTKPEEIASFLAPMAKGESVGVISEAGCPAIADPGADVVAIAQKKGYDVMPLVGPSSILLSLMGSGFNGQSFAFLGYLPIDASERNKQLKRMEQRIYSEHQTQIFIETPYRNMKLVADLLQHCQAGTKLCIASDLTLPTQYIKTLTVAEWKKKTLPNLEKRPTIFLLYK